MGRAITLIDGGMGQELTHRSGQTPTPLWSTRVMLDNPDLVEEVHIDFINAGAKVITLNNYTATPARLMRDADISLFQPIHETAIRVAHDARQKSDIKDVKIAGCLPPIIASYKPELAPCDAECQKQFQQLVDIQKDGVDVMFCETIATIREAVAAVRASRAVGLPTVISFTLDDDHPHQLRSGETLEDAVRAVKPFGVEAITINCSMPETVSVAMPLLVKLFPKVGGYANGFQSVTGLEAGDVVSALKARKDLTPQTYADYVMDWIDMGASIVGGCCEVGPDHIAHIRDRLLDNGYDIVSL